MTWEVRVETKEGGETALRKGFPTRDDAEDYRAQLNLWKHVWVQSVEMKEGVRPSLWKRVWVQETAPERPVERRRA